MSNVDKIKDIVTNPKKPTAATKLVNGNEEDIVIPETVNEETAATNEESENTESSIVKSEAVSKAFSGGKKPEKKLKGIYIDVDVLEKYEEEAAKPERGRGWGSQLVSDLLREVFEQQGIMPKKKN
ncbi:hypothetical protein ABKP09_19665 [Peribacillus frigoritolerans]|uniref:hypothetical protein n=1 Tax=Peribacillus frigoritolerans TaxID=450367 RepID=UPI0032B4B8B5